MTRLMFGDDEPRVLQGLRQSLHGKRKLWDMVFVEGAAAALVELDRAPFDAVVSDMRMPGMDGADLLKRVRVLQPAAFRVVLSGQMDEATAARAASAAHRFLAKPCDSNTLVITIARALELRTKLASEEMRKCIGGMAGLPSPPSSCLALNRALEDDNVKMSTITSIVESDVGMSVKVLQLINSAFFGLSRQVASVGQAVAYLGINAVRSLVLADALFEALAGSRLDLHERAQALALSAARFVRLFPLAERDREVAVTAAMLHNVGQLALISRMPEEYRALRDHARTQGMGLDEAERLRLGVGAAEIGAYLLGLWGLPEAVIEAVGMHRYPLDGPGATLDPAVVVQLAAHLAAQALGITDADLPPASEVAREQLGVAKLMATVQEKFAQGQAG